jgi:hypothetical protein
VRLDHYAAIPHDAAPGRRRHRQRLLVRRQGAPPREGLYAASKAAMNAFSEGLWERPRRLEHPLSRWSIPGRSTPRSGERGRAAVRTTGTKYPPQIVVDAIFEVDREARYEVNDSRAATRC